MNNEDADLLRNLGHAQDLVDNECNSPVLCLEKLPKKAQRALREDDHRGFAVALVDSKLSDSLSVNEITVWAMALYLKYQGLS